MKKIILGIIAVIGIVAVCNIARPRMKIVSFDVYYVQPGDTLWDIAKEYTPDTEDIRVYFKLLKKCNENLSENIQVGQEIRMPILEVK